MKDKQIEECYDLEEIIYISGYGLHRGNCYDIANKIQEQGYRKASEVAEEIFAEIEKLSHKFMNDKHYIFGDMVWDIAELKKKYTEEGK